MLIAGSLATVAFLIFPFCHNQYLYYFLNALYTPLSAIFTLPFVPDLIREEGQPIAILFTNLFLGVGKGAITGLLSLVASGAIPDGAVYIIIGIITGGYTLLASREMKDVVKS